jgi:hypothetical protein
MMLRYSELEDTNEEKKEGILWEDACNCCAECFVWWGYMLFCSL